MKQLTIISGKGGTGKTTLTAAFAHLADNPVIADCDVDAADLHLLLAPEIKKEGRFYGNQLAEINTKRCSGCGLCAAACRFGSIRMIECGILCSISSDRRFEVDPVSCEGCAICAYVCTEKAVSMRDRLSGYWYISDTKKGHMVHAKLGIAAENSGKLVSLVREKAKELAETGKREIILIDGPPGIGCPVIASIGGVDLVLVVTEPTLSGLHDLKRILDVTNHFNIRSMVCINRCDINSDNTRLIEEYCEEKGIVIAGEIPYDPAVTKAMMNVLSVAEYPCGRVTEEVRKTWERIEDYLQT